MSVDHITIALDRSVRRVDVDGRLHVDLTNISKANVCPYYGREIPGARELGLEPNTVYQILRDPDELKKAAPTFNNVPLLDEHVIVTPDNPKKNNVVGSTGTDAVFQNGYLRNSLVVWDAEAIARIESGEQKEISCAYRYVAVRREGVHDGRPYTLTMSNIQANHVALVREGRAGPDVVVADGKLGEVEMKFSVVKTKVAEKIALDSALTDDDRKRLMAAFDAMEEEMSAEDEEETEEEKAARMKAEAADKKAKDKRAKDKAARDKAAKDAEGETEEEKAAREKAAADKKAKDEESEQDEEAKKAEDKKAMDAAIQSGIAQARAAWDNLTRAKEDVAPHVGAVHGLDSAEAVYRFALDAASVAHKGIEELSALKAMVAMLPKPGGVAPIAMDSKARGSVTELFPALGRYA